MKYIAHTKDGRTYTCDDECQLLIDHLQNVANYARTYAMDFDAPNEAFIIGLVHDIGKYQKEFQSYIKGDKKAKINHSTEGALKILNMLKEMGILYAIPVACHHTGLKNTGTEIAHADKSFYAMLNDYYPGDYEGIPYLDIKIPTKYKKIDTDHMGFSFATYTKILFSCLVDADWTDTEEFVKGVKRKSIEYDFDVFFDKVISAIPSNDGSNINNIRAKILKDCIEKSEQAQGLYSLTVPTGGGKTFSSLAFALKHAKKHNLKRIIYVIPYTSIIEQNAKVISKALGSEYVLEHHSNKIYGDDIAMQWASENWDIPIVLTTNVQFFESFFSNRTSRCRKLHNIAKSVVIFDEVQMIPLEYISPSYYAICELIKNYNVTSILCSATQPNIEKYKYESIDVVEIVNNPKELSKQLNRVVYKFIKDKNDDELITMLKEEPRALVIVNTRKHANYLYKKANNIFENVYHLSTLLTPYDRSSAIGDIKRDLATGKKILVISTQLIEAGVDIDFPVVFRSIAGIDSIVQAAGRANREGKLKTGKVYIFQPNEPHSKIPKSLLPHATIAKEIISVRGMDAFNLEGIRQYYSQLYAMADSNGKLDLKDILNEFKIVNNIVTFNYETVAQKFKIIENNTYSVVINNGEINDLVANIRANTYTRTTLRNLGKHTVNIYKNEFIKLMDDRVLEEILDGLYLLNNENYYTNKTGLKVFSEENLNAECYFG